MIEHEEMAVSQLLLTPRIRDETAITSDMFTDHNTRDIYTAILGVIDKGIKPDLISILDYCPVLDRDALMRVSGIAPSSANWKYYEKVIVSEWKRRELCTLGLRLSSSDENHEELLQAIEVKLSELSYATGRKIIGKASEYVGEFITELKRRYDSKGELPGLSTGIDKLDGLIQGLRPRLLYCIGGRPSQGKSALGLNIAAHVTMKTFHNVGFLSLESSVIELIGRLLSSTGNIDGRKINNGLLSAYDLGVAQETGAKIFNAPLWFWDQPNAKLQDVVSTARYMRRHCKVELLILDYLQLINVPGAVDRRDSVAQSSMAMKQLARELDIPVIVLAQLNRDSDNRRPEMGDFQWSSQIEQDADVAIMLYHKYTGEEDQRVIDKSWLFVEKCRDGQRGSVPVVFRQEYVRFDAHTGKGEV